MKQAVKSDAFIDFRQVLDRDKEYGDAEVVKEKHLASFALSDGWLALKGYIVELKLELSNINKSMMERGASFEEIGKNAVIVQLADDLLTKIIQKVEDANEAINK